MLRAVGGGQANQATGDLCTVAGDWQCTNDRNAKENFVPTDGLIA